MSISPVGPFSFGEEVLKTQMDQLDINATYLLDQRHNHNDTLDSSLQVASDGELSVTSKASLSLDPSAFKTQSTFEPLDDTIKIGAQLVGDVNQNDPLRFGYTNIQLNSTNIISGSYTLSASDASSLALRFSSSNNLGSINLIFPVQKTDGFTNIGFHYVKLIDNQCLNGTVLNLIPSGTVPVSLNSGESAIVFCDGQFIVGAGGKILILNQLINSQCLIFNNFDNPSLRVNQALASASSTSLYTVLQGGQVRTSGKASLPQPTSGYVKQDTLIFQYQSGDLFEVILNGAMTSSADVFARMAVQGFRQTSGGSIVENFPQTQIGYLAPFYNGNTSKQVSNTIFQAKTTGTIAFGIVYFTGDAGNFIIPMSPTTLTIKQYRTNFLA